MESIPKNDILRFNPDTLQQLRKQYNLENPLRINKAIDILEEWLMKQEHFAIKTFPRDYLERAIILGKGSVEKVKQKLDRLCTFRTLIPSFFEEFDADAARNTTYMNDTLLPDLTPDNYRVYFLKVVGKVEPLENYFKYFLATAEYIHTYDYCNGVITIIDYSAADLLEVAKKTDMLEVRKLLTVFVEGYGLRLKGMHLISPNKLISVMVNLFKQATSAKLSQRIYVHKNLETLNDVVPINIMPSAYSGRGKSLNELHGDLVDALSSEEFNKHLAKMREACTKEELRPKHKFNNDILGMPGTFRSLCLD